MSICHFHNLIIFLIHVYISIRIANELYTMYVSDYGREDKDLKLS